MQVLIVGAGPTGLSLGYLLARRGIGVKVLEREPDFTRIFRGEALMPSGVDAISQMGLREQFFSVPHRTVERMELYVEGSRVLRADWPELAGPNAAYVVSQPALLEMIARAAAQYSNFDLRMGTTVRDIKVLDDRVEIHAQRENTNETLTGDFIIGADGRASVVRTRSGLKLERLPFPFDVNWFSLPLPPTQQEDPRFQAFSRRGCVVVLYPSWDDRLRLGLSLPAQSSRNRALGKNELLDEVVQVVGDPIGGFIRLHKEHVSEPVELKVLFGRCASWSAPRTLLLGDAAHPMSPVRAQGINLALRDAIVAANHLIPVSQNLSNSRWQHAAAKIQEEREPEIIESQRLQLLSAQPPPPARSAFLRRTVLPVLRSLGISKRAFLRAEMPLRKGLVSVQLTV